MTEKQLIRGEWWWRKETKDRCFDEQTFTTKMKEDHKDDAWKRDVERHALAYELARRHKRAADLPPFPKADPIIQNAIGEICQTSTEILVPALIGEGLNPEALELEALMEYPHPAWGLFWLNLAAPINAIVKKVEAQKRRSRAKTKDVLRGRDPSWRWPELMDLRFYGLLPVLGENDRHKLSCARRLAEKYFQNLEMFLRA